MRRIALIGSLLAICPTIVWAQANFVLPAVPKEAVFNVPVNINNLPQAVVNKISVICEVHSSVNPPTNDSGGTQLAAGSESVNLVNGAYNGMVKVSFTVPATDVAKAKSWRCRMFASGPTFSQFNLDLYFNLPDAAKPAPGTTPKTSASGKYD
ncbi:MAG: hypothetical protein HYS18_01510 [Burkholderiales bacterium]|nr:hypothetical protein [Burkholderiales bacterium]